MRALVLALAVAILACGGTVGSPSVTQATPQPASVTKATIVLEKGGEIVIVLRPDKAPKTVANFVKKARDGFYNGLTFHRVVANFVAQGGDPLGTGTGGGQQPTETSDLPFTKGAVGIARGGDPAISNDAQFFICTGDARHLDRQYTNFGQVTSGQDTADRIKVGDKIKTIRIE